MSSASIPVGYAVTSLSLCLELAQLYFLRYKEYAQDDIVKNINLILKGDHTFLLNLLFSSKTFKYIPLYQNTMVRIAVVKKALCNPSGCGNFVCIRFCPVNRMGKECITESGSAGSAGMSGSKAVIDEKLCIGCNICVQKCPYDAVHIINLPETMKSQPVHRYSQNGFVLYSMPTPIFGKVVGIIGKNGIGKSTAIKILAGALNPNLGEFDQFGKPLEKSMDDLVKYFKGTEAQGFFEKLRDKKIKVSYKPQHVDMIPQVAKGSVQDLLNKSKQCDNSRYEEIINTLELNLILRHDIKDISGGELQRVAIAATMLKDADLYIFDEPTSYLDIKQRVRVSNLIRSMVEKGEQSDKSKNDVAVLVVEHDLVVLDFITDLIHIMYGREAVFGVVSGVKSSKAGINTYLEGYLKEENVRFRDSSLKFEAKPPVHSRAEDRILTEWHDIQKKLGTFTLSAVKGFVPRKKVIGVVGENGIGKTSFVKILAGVILPDSGEITTKIKVSYKPQYIPTSDQLVADALKDCVSKYEVQLMRPLGLKELMFRKINELSGGELQRVAIASCLSQDANLFLLDEPSAYLDVEQRIIVSKIIRDMIESRGATALVVDHDLLFIDYLSEKMTIFKGQPAINGEVLGPFSMEQGMNSFLEGLNITLRHDPENARPRINKPGSVLDREQKEDGKLYYS